MAEINIEKKKSIWPWIIAAIIAALIIWALVAMNDDEVAEAEVAPAAVSQVEPIEPSAAPVAPMDAGATSADAGAVAVIPVAMMLAGPANYAGQEISGTARVIEVPTDRGFWIEQDGQRMLAVIAQSPNMEDAVNINAGQQIQLNDAVVHDATSAAQIAGNLDPQTRQLIEGQAAFLLVEPNRIEVVSR